jgi:hypothetical protein
MIKKTLMLMVIVFTLFACTGNHEKRLAELDEIYGCDNPARNLNKFDYKQCLAAQRANNESFFDINNSFKKAFNLGGDQTIAYQNPVNPSLWNAALDFTSSYSLKIADNQGGYIETDWIYENSSPLDRCLIKIRIVSAEIVSNGVVTNFICENKINDQWVSKKEKYTEEEKRLTLKILKTAVEVSESTL